MRTPLNGILCAVELLKEAQSEQVPDLKVTLTEPIMVNKRLSSVRIKLLI
jgi:hypothetical protein